MYSPEAPYQVYCPRCWWSDNWDPFEYGRDYDFSRNFFEQWNDLLRKAPLLGLSIDFITADTSPYNNFAGHLKNCYLLFWADFTEDATYGFYVYHNKTVLDCSLLFLCEYSYDLTHAYKTNRGIGSQDLTESIDCAFLKNCHNCQNCFASANLRNKKYYIFNKPHTKEEYFKEIKKWDLGSYKTYQEIKTLAEEHWKKFPPMPRFEEFATNCTGNRIYESKNCQECFEVSGAEDSKYLFAIATTPTKNCYDVSGWGNNVSLLYEGSGVGEYASNLKFCQESGINLYNAEYCKLSTGGSDHFGCVSMKKGKYCILNKRYPEEEYSALREKIIQQMNAMPYADKKGKVYRYGEFFPIELSPHAYNETLVQHFFPLSKEDAKYEGYRWREPDVREYTITKPAIDLPDHTRDVGDDVLQEVIGCLTCPRGFKIIPAELQFLRQMNLPLPRRCPFCRIGEKLAAWAKEMRLVTRACDRCGAKFETPHTREETPHLLCKKCYLEEIL